MPSSYKKPWIDVKTIMKVKKNEELTVDQSELKRPDICNVKMAKGEGELN